MVKSRNVFIVGGRFGFFKFTVTVISSWSATECNIDWDLLVIIKSMSVAEVGVILVGLLITCVNLALEIICLILLLSHKILSLKSPKI